VENTTTMSRNANKTNNKQYMQNENRCSEEQQYYEQVTTKYEASCGCEVKRPIMKKYKIEVITQLLFQQNALVY
jgi:hypothetical protein